MILKTWRRYLIFTIVIAILCTISYFVNRLHSVYSSIRSWRNAFDVVQTTGNTPHNLSKESVQINNDGTITINCTGIRKEDTSVSKSSTGCTPTPGIFLTVKDAKAQYRLMLIYIVLQDISNKIESGDDFASDLEMVKMLSSSIPNLQLLFSRIDVTKVKTKVAIETRSIALKSKIDWCIHSIKYKNHFLAIVTFWLKKLFSIAYSDETHSELNYDNIAKEISDLNCKDAQLLLLKQDVSDIIAVNLVMNEVKQFMSALLLKEYNAPSVNE